MSKMKEHLLCALCGRLECQEAICEEKKIDASKYGAESNSFQLVFATTAEEIKLGVKYDQGKSRMDLLPSDALLQLGKVMDFGAGKYAPDNWRKGIPFSKLQAASDRHAKKFMSHLHDDLDEESGINHLAHKIVNDLMTLQFILEKRKELDDRYKGDKDE